MVENEQPGPVSPCLVVKGGANDGVLYTLQEGTSILVGSGRLAHLRVEHPDIGSAHVRVTWDDGGISVTDNGSITGTYVNGEQVETALLMDGDHISFAAPGAKLKTPLPRVLVRIPPGTVVMAPLPPPPSPDPSVEAPRLTAPAPAAPSAPRIVPRVAPKRPRFSMPELPDLRGVGLAAGVTVALAALIWGVAWLVWGRGPLVLGVQPPAAEAGQAVTIVGKRFADDPAANTVWFGEQSAAAVASTGTSLTVAVPALPTGHPAEMPVSVETRRGRSKPIAFRIVTPVRITALEPEAAVAGEEVTARGQGFGGGAVIVTVGGKPAQVVEAKATAVRFKVPAMPPPPGFAAPVVVKVGTEATRPVELLLGHLPLVVEVSPPRGAVGDAVTLRGRGFSANPAENSVTIGGVQALVLSASPHELKVVAPLAGGSRVVAEAEVAVDSAGKPSGNRGVFTLLRPASGAFVLRFFASAVSADSGNAKAFVSTEVGPLLLLASPDGAASTAERAVKVAQALNAVADAQRAGKAVALEAVDQPFPGVSLSGGSTPLVRATADDAAAYAVLPGEKTKAGALNLRSLAAFWAALANDYLSLFVQNQRPMRLLALTPRARALADLRSALVWQPGVGIPNEKIGTLSADLSRRLREMALLVPEEGQGQAASAVEGTWEGDVQEEAGQKAIVVRFRVVGTRLTGSVTTRARGVAMDVPLKDVAVDKGVLRFTLPGGAATRHYVGKIEGATISGSLHTTPAGPSVGTFRLKYVP